MLTGAAIAANASTMVTLLGETSTANTIHIVDPNLPSGSVTAYASPENAKIVNGSSTSYQVLFCCDLSHYSITNSAKVASVLDTASLGSNFQLAAKYYNHFEPTIAGNVNDEAALQLVIWKALYSADAPNPTFSGNSTIETIATGYFSTDVSGASNHATVYDFGGANQNMLGASQPVPEPSMFVGVGFCALGLLRRKKN